MARRKERKKVLDRAQPQLAGQDLSFDEAADLFYNNLLARGLSERTRSWHMENLTAFKKLLKAEDQETRPGLISPAALKNHFILPMVKKKLKVNTINMRICSCSALFKFLCEEKLLSQNPAARISKLKKEKPLIETFTKQQVKDLLAVIDQTSFVGFRDYVMILTFLETRLRVGEAANLRVEDLLFEESVIRIVRGKGAKGRRLPFQDTLAGLLKQYLSERGQVSHPYLFINRDDAPLKKRTIQERFTIYGKKAGLTGVRCSPHTMRHTMAKLYIMSGGDIFSLQKILGHSTLEMVRYYVELFGHEINEQHRKHSPIKDLT